MANRTADEVLADPTDALPEGAYVTSAIVIYEYVIPGEDDEDIRGPFLVFNRSQTTGKWSQLGMLETVANDWRIELGQADVP